MGSPSAPERPEQIGPYRILESLGEGGMGTVFVAEQTSPVRRKVALKLIKLGMDSKAVVARFEQERQALALMQHDGIARVFDCGTSDRGQPYFVMELVRGIPLTDYCDAHRLTLPERIRLMQQVCDAVQHAHQKGVVHRDLKPGNVLVSEETEKAQIKIIDFGLAKAMGQKLVEATLFTEAGQVIGTPEYMAPEQADPTNQDIDTRADIYSLGVMLYEVLAGVLPFTAMQVREAGLLEMQRVLKEVEPPKPSTKLSSSPESATAIAEHRRTSAAALRKALQNDLDWLVLKALEKDRTRRYETANALKTDLQRYLDHKPLVAGPPSAAYRLKKLVQRYRGQVLAGTAVFATAVIGAIVAVDFAFAAAENEQRAKTNEGLANQRAEENAKLAQSEAVAKNDALHEKGRADDKARELDAKVREFDQLAAVMLYQRLVAREQKLWPPWPHKVEAMELWLREDAGKLLAMRDDIDRTVRELRARALPQTAEEVEADRRSHPRFGEYETAARQAASLRYAQAIRAGKQLVEPSLTPEQQAMDARELRTFAWERVAPKVEERRVWGEEALGLAAARLAATKAKGTPTEFEVLDMLAWALLANGQDDPAKQASEQAYDLAPKERATRYRQLVRDVTGVAEQAVSSLEAAEAKIVELGALVSERRTWSFAPADESRGFLHDTLVDLLGKLSSLASSDKIAVERRLVWAKQIRELTLAHPNSRHTWAVVRAAIASNPKYAGQVIELRDEDVMGLVPIGEHPITHLWEFYDLRSACDGRPESARALAIPQHETDGSIRVTGDTGIVFVLLPGGKFSMGAQSRDPSGPNYDPHARSNEAPLHEVTLSAFFLAKHEMTQGQWARLWGGDESLRHPSYYRPGKEQITLANPVELVDWTMCFDLLRAQGLELPTEAQWEYGCRAGTTTSWVCDVQELKNHANVADATAKRAVPNWGCESWSDGYVVHAPVGSFAINAFGLHDMHGNVAEWCRDWYAPYRMGWQREGGLPSADSSSGQRVYRGGCFNRSAPFARSALRDTDMPSYRGNIIGLRAARSARP